MAQIMYACLVVHDFIEEGSLYFEAGIGRRGRNLGPNFLYAISNALKGDCLANFMKYQMIPGKRLLKVELGSFDQNL